MRIAIVGHDLPGRTFCREDGSLMDDVHVGVQVRRDPDGLVPGDAGEARWEADVEVLDSGADDLDFKGPAVHGRPGDRFLYLTWGHVSGSGDSFEMFRRAKLMLNRVSVQLVRDAVAADGALVATVDLTGSDGGPRCARVDPPAIVWSRSSA